MKNDLNDDTESLALTATGNFAGVACFLVAGSVEESIRLGMQIPQPEKSLDGPATKTDVLKFMRATAVHLVGMIDRHFEGRK